MLTDRARSNGAGQPRRRSFAFARGKDGPGNRRRSTRCYRHGKMSGRTHLHHVLEIVSDMKHVEHSCTQDLYNLFILTLRLIVQAFPVRHCSLTRSFSSVPRVVPRRLGNRPQDDQKSPALSVARPRYITTNQSAHQPSTPLTNFSLLHTPRSDRRPTVRPRHQSSPPPPHARSLALHRSTLAGPTRARPRSLASSSFTLAPPPNPVAVRESEIPLHLLYANAHNPDLSSCDLRVSIYIRLFHSHDTIQSILLFLINNSCTLSHSFTPLLFLAVPMLLSLFNQLCATRISEWWQHSPVSRFISYRIVSH